MYLNKSPRGHARIAFFRQVQVLISHGGGEIHVGPGSISHEAGYEKRPVGGLGLPAFSGILEVGDIAFSSSA